MRAIIAPKLAIGLAIVSALSLLAFFVLSAFAPDLRNDSSGTANALSKSAIGFAGLRFLVDNTQDQPMRLNRNAHVGWMGLLVLTPEIYSAAADVDKLSHNGIRLIVLPKWIAARDPLHPGWVTKAGTYPGQTIALPLADLLKDITITQGDGEGPARFKAVNEIHANAVPTKPVIIDRIQTISGKKLDPDIVDGADHIVLAHISGTTIFILAEPDLLNNQGLHDGETARAGLNLINALQYKMPAMIDVSLNGFRSSPDLVRTVFTPPFLGATLCALLAAALIAFHAMSRFGSPKLPDRVFAFGKRALADNTAAVIRIMRREPRMAPRYAQTTLNLVTTQLGVPPQRAADPEWVSTVERRGVAAGEPGFAQLRLEANNVEDTAELVRVARKLFRWRRGILHERG
jgi:hypothetical protein